MGYACPVCETPQADAHHLANHLAFTAMLGDADHESWLDEHAPDWESAGDAELADRVVDHSNEVEFPQVFEDTTGHAHDHDGEAPRPGDLFDDQPQRQSRGSSGTGPDLDPATADAIEDAREMAREVRGDPDGEERGDADADDGTADTENENG